MKKENNLKQLLQIRNSTTTSVDLYIYGDIVASEDYKWDDEDTYPVEVKNFLNEANGRDVNIYINSGGGSVFAGLAIANMIKRYNGVTRSYIDGLCGSIATIIALSCNEKYIASNALFMYHKAWGRAYLSGNAKDFREQADEFVKSLDAIDISLLETYRQNLNDDSQFTTIQTKMESGKDTWLTADETVGFFNIQMTGSKEMVAYAQSDFYDKATAPKQLLEKPKKEIKQQNLADIYMFDFL